MSIIYGFFPSPNSIQVSVINPSTVLPKSISFPPNYSSNKKSSPFRALAYVDVNYLETAFGGQKGITFSGIGDSCAVRVTLDNGCSANLMLPTGLITSFKARMWHGGSTELLHISVSVPVDTNDDVYIQGGLSSIISCENEEGFSWSPTYWNLHHVRGTSKDSIQVELISSCDVNGTQVKNILTLGQDSLTSEICVTNSSSSSSLRLTGSVLCHLTLSTPDATYALGLEGSDYIVRPPFASHSSLVPPEFCKTKDENTYSSPLNKLFLTWVAKNADDVEGEEEDNCKHLTQKMSRIYSNAPRNVTIIDRGRRISVLLRRNGFAELYLFSPGSSHEWFGKYSYVSVGHAALKQPIILKAQSEWRGGMHLWNPNT